MSKSKCIPDVAERLSAATAAKRALFQRAKAAAADPGAIERRKAREAVVAARNARIAQRRAAAQAMREREEAERAAAEAAAGEARQAARKAAEEARAAHETERAVAQAAEKAKLEAILETRRAGRKKKKRR